MQRFPCKHAGCDKFVEFDGLVTVPVNLNSSLSLTGTNDFDLDLFPENGNAEPLDGMLNIRQAETARHPLQMLPFHLDAQTSTRSVTAYLTCSDGHTEPYTVTIKK